VGFPALLYTTSLADNVSESQSSAPSSPHSLLHPARLSTQAETSVAAREQNSLCWDAFCDWLTNGLLISYCLLHEEKAPDIPGDSSDRTGGSRPARTCAGCRQRSDHHVSRCERQCSKRHIVTLVTDSESTKPAATCQAFIAAKIGSPRPGHSLRYVRSPLPLRSDSQLSPVKGAHRCPLIAKSRSSRNKSRG